MTTSIPQDPAGEPARGSAAEPPTDLVAEHESVHDESLTGDKPEGAISAAIIAAGVGSAALGLFTVLAEASESVASWLRWNDGVGPLSGKTGLAVIVWLVAWVVLHMAMRRRRYESRRALTIALVLIAIGVLGTFPTFFQLFAPE